MILGDIESDSLKSPLQFTYREDVIASIEMGAQSFIDEQLAGLSEIAI